MGNCTSFDSIQNERAKLVLQDGTIQQFSYAVKVSYLLQLYPSCFICDSDEMGLNEVVYAMKEDEVLKPGQLYFALPLTQLKRPLSPVELAGLAVKASSALNKIGAGEKCWFRRKRIVMFSGDGNGKSCRRVVPESGDMGVDVSVVRSRSLRRRNCGGDRRRERFMSALSIIPE